MENKNLIKEYPLSDKHESKQYEEYQLSSGETPLDLLSHPWKLITQGKKLGIKGVMSFGKIMFLFGVTNFFLVLYAVIRLFSSGFTANKALFVFLVLSLGIGITIYAGYRAYQYVAVEALRTLYDHFKPLLEKVCFFLIDKTETIVSKNTEGKNNQLSQAINIGKIIDERYKSSPSIIKKSLTFLLKRIPLSEMLIELKNDITTGNKEGAGAKLYSKVDRLIHESIFDSNNTRWTYWLLPLNLALALLLIHFKIGY